MHQCDATSDSLRVDEFKFCEFTPGLGGGNLASGVSHGKPHLKNCVARLRGHLNIAPMLPYNPLHGIQPQSRTFSNWLGGEKRFKDVRLYLRGNSRTVIGDLHYHAAV